MNIKKKSNANLSLQLIFKGVYHIDPDESGNHNGIEVFCDRDKYSTCIKPEIGVFKIKKWNYKHDLKKGNGVYFAKEIRRIDGVNLLHIYSILQQANKIESGIEEKWVLIIHWNAGKRGVFTHLLNN
jgi:hypothetical protein